jgi:hypothetical protein
MIAHQTVDWTKGASNFESINEIGFAGDVYFHCIVTHGLRPGAESETHGAMVHEVEKAAWPKLTEENQLGRLNHEFDFEERSSAKFMRSIKNRLVRRRNPNAAADLCKHHRRPAHF